MFTTINKSKFGDCSQCNEKDTLVVKRKKDLFCLNCARLNKVKEQLVRSNMKNNVRKLISYQREVNPDLIHKVELEKWFSKIKEENTIPSINGYGGGCACWECGTWIPLGYIRHATAHILAKSFFVSICTHPNNFLILGAGCGCHSKYDRSWDDASQMRVFKEAKKRFLTFADNIALTERRRIPECFTEKPFHESHLKT